MDSKRKVIAGVTGLAVLAGAGGVYAASNDGADKEGKAFSNDVAKRLDVTPEKLDGAVQGAFQDRLDAAVKAGKLTQKQADEIAKRVKEDGGVHIGGPGFGPGGPGGPGERGEMHFRGPGGPGDGGPFGEAFDAAAKYLGLSKDELRKQVEPGKKSLADVAKDKNKDVAGLKSAMKDAIKAKLDKAVKDEDLTQKQEDAMLKDLDSHIDDIVAGKRPPHPKFRMHFEGPGGPPTTAPAPPNGGSFEGGVPGPPPPAA
jgi:hypothetical protein